MSHIGFQTHEFEADYIYTEHGRQGYFAIGRLVDASGGSGEWTFDLGGDTWKVKLYYQEGGIKPRPDDNIPRDQPMHEYRLKCRPVTEHDRRKVTFHIRPRWDGMRDMSGEEIETPFVHDQVHIPGHGRVDMADEGINVSADCSNIAAERVPGIFGHFVDAIADEIGVNLRNGLFDSYHPMSNVDALEGYVRYADAQKDKFVYDDGVLWRIFHLLGDREGNVVEYLADNEETVGHMHKVKVSEGDPEQLIDGHRYNKQFKSYYPKTLIDEGPLANPKFGVLVHAAWHDGTIYVDDIGEVRREIEEAGNNVLRWAGIDVDPETGPWVEDDHFEPRPGDYPVEFVADPTPKIEREQDQELLRVLTNGTDADLEMVQELSANGGQQHYSAFEKASSTVYRMKERLPELIDSDNGLIRIRSKKLQDDLHEMLERTETEIGRWASAISDYLGLEAEYLDAVEGELERFVRKYQIEFSESDSKLLAEVGTTLTTLKSLSDTYPQAQAVVKRLRKYIHRSPRVDGRPVVVEWENARGEIEGETIHTTLGRRRAAPR